MKKTIRRNNIKLQLFADKSKIADTNIKTNFQVKNEIDNEVAEMYLYGTIREAYPWEDEDECISANRVLNALKEVGEKDIDIHINSGGGDVFESIAIHNTLKQHKGKVNIIVDALAGSGASVIAMAGDTVKMFDSSMMMIHKAWTVAMGNSDDLRKQADDLEKIDSSVQATYEKRFVGTTEELEELISDESWLTADECKVFGLCDDEITQEPKTQANIKKNLFNKYKKDIQPQEPVNIKTSLFNKFKPGGSE